MWITLTSLPTMQQKRRPLCFRALSNKWTIREPANLFVKILEMDIGHENLRRGGSENTIK